MQFPISQRFQRLLAMDEIFSAVPQHHRAAAVFPFGNHALELRVIDRVIFNFDGEMLFALLPWKSFRHGPRFQNAFHFQAEVVMQPARIMFLNDKAGRSTQGFRLGLVAFRLRSH